MPTLEDMVRGEFPGITGDFAIVDSRMKPGAGQNRGKLEFYPPDERDNPLPGRTTIELFSPMIRDQEVPRYVAADLLHGILRERPELNSVREEFKKTLSQRQRTVDRNAYNFAVQNLGETRSFNDWFETSRLDQYFIAQFIPEGPDRNDWLSHMTPRQRAMIAGVEKVLRKPPRKK